MYQKDLDRISEWSGSRGLTVNTSKCSVLTISRKNCSVDFNYHLCQEAISKVTVAKDLGILIDNRLKFDQYIQQIVSKSNRVLWMLKRTIATNDYAIRKLFYVSIVRPILE